MGRLQARGALDTSFRMEQSGLELQLKGPLTGRCLTGTWALWATAGLSCKGQRRVSLPLLPGPLPASALTLSLPHQRCVSLLQVSEEPKETQVPLELASEARWARPASQVGRVSGVSGRVALRRAVMQHRASGMAGKKGRVYLRGGTITHVFLSNLSKAPAS